MVLHGNHMSFAPLTSLTGPSHPTQTRSIPPQTTLKATLLYTLPPQATPTPLPTTASPLNLTDIVTPTQWILTAPP
jgi:hypothetical protein